MTEQQQVKGRGGGIRPPRYISIRPSSNTPKKIRLCDIRMKAGDILDYYKDGRIVFRPATHTQKTEEVS